MAGNPPTFFVVNKAPTQGTEGTNAVEYIKKQGFSVAPVILHLRAAHRHASNIGKVAAEYEVDSKAAKESLQLYTYTVQLIDTQRNAHAKTEPTLARA